MSEWQWKLKDHRVYKNDEIFVTIDETVNSVYAVGILMEELNQLQSDLAAANNRVSELEAENARLQRLAETERQNATTTEAQASKWKVAYEKARAREDQYFQWVSDLCDHVDNDIVMQITGVSMPRATTPPEPEARFKVVIFAYDKYTGMPSRWGIKDGDNNHYLADGEPDDHIIPYSHVKHSWGGAWEFDNQEQAQARADELNASDS